MLVIFALLTAVLTSHLLCNPGTKFLVERILRTRNQILGQILGWDSEWDSEFSTERILIAPSRPPPSRIAAQRTAIAVDTTMAPIPPRG